MATQHTHIPLCLATMPSADYFGDIATFVDASFTKRIVEWALEDLARRYSSALFGSLPSIGEPLLKRMAADERDLQVSRAWPVLSVFMLCTRESELDAIQCNVSSECLHAALAGFGCWTRLVWVACSCWHPSSWCTAGKGLAHVCCCHRCSPGLL